MQNDILDAISTELSSEFEGFDIYSKPVKQGASTPCFYIKALSISKKQMIGNRFKMQFPFEISFYGDDEKVADKLFNSLLNITLQNGDKLLGRKMKTSTKDGVLSFFVEYSMFVKNICEVTYMGEIKRELSLR